MCFASLHCELLCWSNSTSSYSVWSTIISSVGVQFLLLTLKSYSHNGQNLSYFNNIGTSQSRGNFIEPNLKISSVLWRMAECASDMNHDHPECYVTTLLQEFNERGGLSVPLPPCFAPNPPCSMHFQRNSFLYNMPCQFYFYVLQTDEACEAWKWGCYFFLVNKIGEIKRTDGREVKVEVKKEKKMPEIEFWMSLEFIHPPRFGVI